MILLIFIGSASAADGNETDVLSIDESVGIYDEKLALDSSIDNAVANGTNVLRNNGNDLLSADDSRSNENLLKVSTDSSNDILSVKPTTLYVNASVSSSGDGKSKETAFQTLREAWNEATHDDIIMIASGVYTGTDNIGLTSSKNLNFIKFGDGEAILDAQSKSRIWTVTSTSIKYNRFDL